MPAPVRPPGGRLTRCHLAGWLGLRRDEAEAFYRRSMMVCEPEERRRQLETGVCVRVRACDLVHAARLALLPSVPSMHSQGTQRAADAAGSGAGNGSVLPSYLGRTHQAAVEASISSVRSARRLTPLIPTIPTVVQAGSSASLLAQRNRCSRTSLLSCALMVAPLRLLTCPGAPLCTHRGDGRRGHDGVCRAGDGRGGGSHTRDGGRRR